jgi:hypothetical protein
VFFGPGAGGAPANQEADGTWTAPYQLVRSPCLFGASAAGVPAIDTSEQVAHARRVVDLPHLKQAQKILSRSGTSVG